MNQFCLVAAMEPARFLGALGDGSFDALVLTIILAVVVIALFLKASGSAWRPRLARATIGCESRARTQPRILVNLFETGPLHGLLARCRWEIDIFKAYLAETLGGQAGSSLHVAPARHLPVSTSAASSKVTKDRRRWVRHPSNMQAYCQILNDRNERRWRVQIRDISAGGVGLVSPCSVPLGAILLIQFHLPESFPRTIVKAEVMFMSRIGSGEWTLGCEFLEPLGNDDCQTHL